jgi:hypothetical protein
MTATILTVMCVLLILAVIVALTRKYIATRDIGFVWLGLAIVIWPRVSGLLQAFAVNHRAFGGYSSGATYTLLKMSMLAVELSLQLVAILYLYRRNTPASSRDLPPNPVG